MYISLYVIMALTSLTYAFKINTRPGLSTNLRERFISRNVWQTVTFTLAWTPYLGCCYYVLYLVTFEGRSPTEEMLPLDELHISTL